MSECNGDPVVKRVGQRGGFRPGSGAPKGNVNALKGGNNSKRAKRLSVVFRSHPTAARSPKGIGIILGIIDLKARTADLARAVEVFYPAGLPCTRAIAEHRGL